jgi:hypothetical protein
MKNNFDRFFYERLHKSTRIPPDRIWQRIEQNNMDKKRSVKFWRMAAILVVGITSGIFAFRMLNPVQENKKLASNSVINKQEKNLIKSQSATRIEEKKSTPVVVMRPRRSVKPQMVQPIQPLIEEVVITEDQRLITGTESDFTVAEVSGSLITSEENESAVEPMVIIYSLPADGSATNKSVKATAVDRFLNFARDVKSGDVALVDFKTLRQRARFNSGKRKVNPNILF